MSLATTPHFQRVRITGVNGRDAVACRLMEMGVIEGTEVEVLGRAPLGDPMRVRLGDYELSLRSAEAGMIDVAPLR